MDNRRFQELRDVYSQLSRQSTDAQGHPTAESPRLNHSESDNSAIGVQNHAAVAAAAATAASAAAAASATAASATTSNITSGSEKDRGTVQLDGGEIALRAPSSSSGRVDTAVRGEWGGSSGGDSGLATTDDMACLRAFNSPNEFQPYGEKWGETKSPAVEQERPIENHIGTRLMRRGATTRGNEGTAMKLREEQKSEFPLGKRKRKSKGGQTNSFYPSSYFEWTDDLMEKDLPERATGAFVSAIFELGLKHSSPKVLMKLMPPKAHRLTTEHIKSRLQKYRLHAHRSKEEFLEFFDLRLKAKFKEFVDKEGWRKVSPRHSQDDEGSDQEGVKLDECGSGSGVGRGVGGGEGGASGGSEAKNVLPVNVDGQVVGGIRDLGAQCVREQCRLQEMIKHHISAQLRLQAEIHEHLTSTVVVDDVGNGSEGSEENSRDDPGKNGSREEEKNAGGLPCMGDAAVDESTVSVSASAADEDGMY